MPVQAIEPARLGELRNRAAARLNGAAAAKGSAARATDALAVLHALASDPETASDALTLLHELQVLQVEVELQAQELRESRAELEIALRRQNEIYDFQPVGCFTIDSVLTLHELNQKGADMLGIDRHLAHGSGLDIFLTAPGKRRLRERLASVAEAENTGSFLLYLCPKGASERPVWAAVGADPSAPRYFLTLTNAGDERDPHAERR